MVLLFVCFLLWYGILGIGSLRGKGLSMDDRNSNSNSNSNTRNAGTFCFVFFVVVNSLLKNGIVVYTHFMVY